MTMRGRTAERIRADLARRGVPEEFSRAMSQELEPVARELAPDAYEAVLAGVAMAWGAQRRGGAREGEPRRPDLDEMERLLGAFAEELGKLDEALELLAAYLTRIRARSLGARRTVH